ncbi:unnamed protein product [marine sediment metagenome]|uniref:Uncharacterized protein n=1 Tax=marine sediment metagenome TaxID=412755 RepID=X0V9P2_9ZZZZ
MSKKVEIRVSLEEEFIEKIEHIKNYYGIKNTTELIRFLITKKYREVTRNINGKIN